ncbi:MAG: serine/threonine protein kinase [Acidobacteriota bacterium]|nr:serine/threonine protein kinase [Acidobacteriota bacterium]
MSHLKQFGKYEIVRKLSRSLTDVYLARDCETDTPVVLKLVEQSRDEFTQVVIEAERRGALLQRQLHETDARILQVFDFGDEQNCFFVAMEYFEGKTLAEVVREERVLDAKRAAGYAAEISNQLKTLHAFVSDVDGRKTAVVHGDIKPSNLQIGASGEVKLLDFGIAKVISLTRNLTQHNLGSPSYCSPERLSKGSVDAHADLWALGVTLYEMVSGVPPYQAQNTRKLENLIQSRRPPRALPESCPAALKAVIEKSLAANLEARYQSADAFEDDLRTFLEDRRTIAESESRPAFGSGPTVAKYPAGSTATRIVAKTRTVLKLPARVVLKSSTGLRQAGVALVAGFLLGLVVLMPAAYLYHFHRASAPLRNTNDYTHRSVSAIAADWNLYQDIAQRSGFLGSFSPTASLAAPFHARLIAAADNIINGYRNRPAQSLNRADWEKAQFCLRRALQIRPVDSKAKGSLALCNGYLNLLQNPKLPKAALSLDQFREASRLLPDSPDPHLGMARLYVYSYRNVAPAVAELHEAQRLGYRPGAREAREAADGYLLRAEWEMVRAKYTLPKSAEKKWVAMAKSDVRRARPWH